MAGLDSGADLFLAQAQERIVIGGVAFLLGPGERAAETAELIARRTAGGERLGGIFGGAVLDRAMDPSPGGRLSGGASNEKIGCLAGQGLEQRVIDRADGSPEIALPRRTPPAPGEPRRRLQQASIVARHQL
ncbi:MAG: hypothetical protein WHV64_11855 [Geminicoccaceae bacterium]